MEAQKGGELFVGNGASDARVVKECIEGGGGSGVVAAVAWCRRRCTTRQAEHWTGQECPSAERSSQMVSPEIPFFLPGEAEAG